LTPAARSAGFRSRSDLDRLIDNDLLDRDLHVVEAPTTMIWRRVGGSWKVALFHSIPLSAAS